MKQYLGRRYDQTDEHGNYVFAMTLSEILTEPTGKDDITEEVPPEHFSIFYDRLGDAYMSFGYLKNNLKYLI
jgi:hypothetical protein